MTFDKQIEQSQKLEVDDKLNKDLQVVRKAPTDFIPILNPKTLIISPELSDYDEDIL